jgi:methylthioribose-1-phosphate isomerase
VSVPHPSPLSGGSYSAAELAPDNRRVVLLDQRKLPAEEEYLQLDTVEAVARAIEQLAVRGAPAIGIAAAYGVAMAAATGADVAAAIERLGRTRPTAVNLAWALARMGRASRDAEVLAAEARAIHREDVAACKRMGQVGAAYVPDGATVLTHCNAGALATGGYGTALGVVRAAREAGKRIRVVACETRPVLQGARLTAWELARDGFDVTLITDSMVAQLMRRRRVDGVDRVGGVDLVVVGADRIARSGDVANKIGTYGVACLANVHGVPFYVAAPWSTIDMECGDGDAIPIEQRSEDEVFCFGTARVAPLGIRADNPAFDVTPARLVSAIFTERGEVRPPSERALRAMAC